MDFSSPKKKMALFEGFSLFALIGVLLIIFAASISADAPLMLVLVGFSPTIITIISCIIIYEEASHRKVILWFLPLILAGLFFYVATGQDFLKSNLDVNALIGINLALSVLYLTIFFLLTMVLFKETSKKAVPGKQKMTVRQYIASIEDKSKALNYVIGRVYNQFHGGNKEMRDKISIPSHSYNAFSEAMHDEEVRDADKMLTILNGIESRLKQLELTEKDVFSESHSRLKNLDRNPSGEDKIIDVLKRNDKDPVEAYYKGALDFCLRLKEQLGPKPRK